MLTDYYSNEVRGNNFKRSYPYNHAGQAEEKRSYNWDSREFYNRRSSRDDYNRAYDNRGSRDRSFRSRSDSRNKDREVSK